MTEDAEVMTAASSPDDAAAAAEPAPAAEHASADFPIVGIGASAGGLAAFEAFFSGMPTDTDPDMAFVLVQHLAPDHKSILTDLIGQYTRMQVYEVADGMVVRPNCAYIIPPGRDMAFLGGTLHLLEPSAPRGQRLPIDFFFRSLAQDQRERAIGIVLSGTGSDGTLGVRAIKGEGGMVMAQTPASTEHDGMPRSAIATGLVDFELPPAEMPAQLIAYVAHAFGKPPRPVTAPPEKAEAGLKKIFVLVRAQTGHDFSQYKPSTIQRRIGRRMAVHQIESLEAYVRFMQQTPAEVEALFRDMLIGVTSFFRDPEAFQALEEQVIPRLFAGRPADSLIRVWSPGCATGEEAYSLAIQMAERQEALRRTYKVQIFATDIDSQAIVTARAGIYPASIAADVAQERLARYFSAECDGAAYRVHKTIRDMLVFSEQDVIRDPPFSRLDLISCRNLLIYMDVELQKRLIPLFHYALNPGGVLFLGTSETVGEFPDLFTPLDRKQKLYLRKGDLYGAQRAVLGRLLPPLLAPETGHPPAAGKPPGAARPPLRELTEQALLQQVAPSAALVSSNGDILYLHGRTGLYLEPAPGEAGVSNILKMAREGLRRELANALHRAVASREVIHSANLRVKTNGDVIGVNLTVRPVTAGPAGSPESPPYLVVLEQTQLAEAAALPGAAAPHGPGVPSPASDADARIAALQQELRAKEEYLQTANEELETANEELKSSNEELQSVNEELQSTNEELETSKEELQSVNEELATVNAELQTKVADLTRANNDMNNLLAGTGIATVFVDHGLHILRFTPAATRIINLIQSDVGRPVGHLVSNLAGYESLPADTREVLDTLVPKEVEVQTKAGIWYMMRILPYRTLDNVIEGAVITFVDIHRLKQTEQALRESERRFRMVIENSRDGINMLDLASGRYVFLSPSQVELTGFTAPELQNLTAEEAYQRVHPDDRELSVSQQKRVAAGEDLPAPVEYRWQVKSGEYRWFSDSRKAVRDEQGRVVALVGVSRDITERKQAEEELRTSEAKYRTLFESMAEGVVYQDRDGKIVLANPAAERILGLSFDQFGGVTSMDPVWKTIHEDGSDFPGETHPAMVALQTGRTLTDVVMGIFNPQKNETRWININSVPQFREGAPQPYQVFTTFSDITHRKRAEQTLRDNAERFRSLVMASSDVVYRMSPDWNEMWQLHGRDFIPDTDGPSGTWLQKYIPPDDQPHVLAVIREAIRTKSIFELEHRVLRADGSLGWTFSRAIPLMNAEGEIAEWIGTARDVTQRRQAEEARRQNPALQAAGEEQRHG